MLVVVSDLATTLAEAATLTSKDIMVTGILATLEMAEQGHPVGISRAMAVALTSRVRGTGAV